MEKKIILVAGVSGVGKSTFCKSILGDIPDSCHLIASRFLKNKDQVLFDQSCLVSAIKKEIEIRAERLIIIDGHLTFSGMKISVCDLKKLDLNAIIVLEDKPQVIAERRINDLSRVRNLEAVDDIFISQAEEIDHGKYVAERLGIELHTFTPIELAKCIEVIKKI